MATEAQVPVEEVAALNIDSKEPAANGTTSPAVDSVAKFKEQFKAFCKFGDVKSDGKLITLSQSDKWMKQAQVSIDCGIFLLIGTKRVSLQSRLLTRK